jgi:hypothetical protein
MQRVKIFSMALMAMLALSAVAVSSASASSFLVHPTGKILGEATNTQIFSANGFNIECTKAAVAGTATVLKTLTQLVHVGYSGCTVTLGEIVAAVTVTPSALFILNADLKVAVESTVKIEIPAAGCTLTIGPGGNQALDSVHYGNEGSDLKVNALVKGITFTSTEGLCGPPGNAASYNGQLKVMSAVAGGVVRWDKE